MPGRYSDEQIEAAVAALSAPGRFDEAESAVLAAAPGLQKLLAGVLHSGGWFDDTHRAEIEKATGLDDPAARLAGVKTLLAEESRLAMMVGVAVGWALADELGSAD